MDKMTKERCLKKAGRLDFARVLVEVSVNEDLPSVLEITYPPSLGNRPAKVGKLEVKYQLKPPLCIHCKTFCHSTLAYRVRPRTSEEIAAKDSFIGNREGDSSKNKPNASNMDEDGFVTMKKNNKPAVPSGKYGGGSLGNQAKPFNKASGNLMKKDVKPANQSKSLQQLSKDPNYKPKVFVRGPSFNNSPVSISLEFIPIKNSFQVLVDEDMVDILMEAGIYLSKAIRLDWTIHHMDYFYKNFHKFHLDPSYEDDDVELEMDGIASEMKPEYDNDVVIDNGNGAAPSSNVSNEVIDLIREDNFSLYGLLETHVKKKKLASIHRKVFGICDWVSNSMSCTGGTRIIAGWNPNIINAMVMDQSAPVMHCFVESINGDLKFHCSFFDAHIHTLDRRSLWKSLQMYSNSIKGAAWIILGDFNATLDPSEKSSGGFKITTAISDFKDCVANIDMDDIAMSGLNFTWNKRPGRSGGLLKKLDRVMGNPAFVSSFLSSHAIFLPFMTSDHTPASFVIPKAVKPNTKPFKFSNYLTSKDGFMPAFRKVWDCKVDGYFMYSLVSKLRMLKKPLRKLNFDEEAEVKCLKSYRYALKDEESFLKQKSKTTWFKEGDMNSKYFHNVVKGRLNRGRIFFVKDVNDLDSLFLNKLSPDHGFFMIRDVSDDEVKNALFDIDGNKAPRPDVDQNQCAFIPDKQISDNIHLSQELMTRYHTNRGVSKCAFKVDIQKTCDSLEWKFMENCLINFGFHKGMIKWIMECVFTTSYSISVNGDIHGFFKGNMGLRQGDLLSLYLFTLEMEFLNLLIKKHVSLSKDFKFHWLCKDLNITHICFADDLLLFFHGDSKTVSVLKKAIDEFGDISGLLPSIPKSMVFFGNVEDVAMARILKVMPLNVGTLPVKYLGVPLISRRVFSKDCQPLIDKPKDLSDKFNGLLEIEPPVLNCKKKDKVMWKTNSGRYVDFAVSSVWNDIRELLGKKYETQDKNGCFGGIRVFGIIRLKGLVKLDNAPNCWSDILNFMLKIPFNKSIWSVLQRLLIGASSYFVWLERNLRIFQRKARSLDDIFNLIKEAVRLRIMGLTLNDTVQVFEAAKLWDFHVIRSMGKRKVTLLNDDWKHK
ncbi:RNA-directed DNA polymerase, eukaryota, reverse transcriptase zinc-binding domain protein [Tanacetum coccineum]